VAPQTGFEAAVQDIHSAAVNIVAVLEEIASCLAVQEPCLAVDILVVEACPVAAAVAVGILAAAAAAAVACQAAVVAAAETFLDTAVVVAYQVALLRKGLLDSFAVAEGLDSERLAAEEVSLQLSAAEVAAAVKQEQTDPWPFAAEAQPAEEDAAQDSAQMDP